MKIPFGRRGDTLLHISEVDRGSDCDCVCPDCGGPLVAKKGVEREQHFAHNNLQHGEHCGGGTETALHQYAKQIISEARYLQLPGFTSLAGNSSSNPNTLVEPKRAEFSRVEIETQMQFGQRRVDVVGYWPEGRLLIEIHVTHRVRGKKLKEVRAADEFMLEIDVPKDLLYSSTRFGPGSLRELILDGVGNKRWLHHPEGEAIRRRLLQKNRPQNNVPEVEPKQSPFPRPVRTTEAIQVRGGHVPSRSGRTPEDYAYDLYLFLSGLECDETLRRQMVSALKHSGNITVSDIETAERLGHPLSQLVQGD